MTDVLKERVCKDCQLKRAKLVWDTVNIEVYDPTMMGYMASLFAMQMRVMNNGIFPSHYMAYMREKGVVMDLDRFDHIFDNAQAI